MNFDFPASRTRLVLEQSSYIYGSRPRIAHFGIKTAAFDIQKVREGLLALGASLLPSETENVLRFSDPDGITVELVAENL